MFITCLDLEGVLIPEVWINFAEKTGIKKLKLTTRDISDYDELMTLRLKIIKEHGLTLQDIQEVIGRMEPLPGAVEFLDWLRSQCQVVILSDTFVEFAKPFMEKLGMPTLFCHELETDKKGVITNYQLRLKDHKKQAVIAFRQLNFTTIAAGDSFNDLSMLNEADHGILFRPPENFKEKFPHLPIVREFSDFKATIQNYLDS